MWWFCFFYYTWWRSKSSLYAYFNRWTIPLLPFYYLWWISIVNNMGKINCNTFCPTSQETGSRYLRCAEMFSHVFSVAINLCATQQPSTRLFWIRKCDEGRTGIFETWMVHVCVEVSRCAGCYVGHKKKRWLHCD